MLDSVLGEEEQIQHGLIFRWFKDYLGYFFFKFGVAILTQVNGRAFAPEEALGVNMMGCSSTMSVVKLVFQAAARTYVMVGIQVALLLV